MKKIFFATIAYCLFASSISYAFDTKCGVVPALSAHKDMLPAIVSVTTTGQATVVYKTSDMPHYGWRNIDFSLEGSGFVTQGYVVTNAHLIAPDRIWAKDKDQNPLYMYVIKTENVVVRVTGMPANVEYVHRRRDTAILSVGEEVRKHTLPFRAETTWDKDDPEVSLLVRGDCIVMLGHLTLQEYGFVMAEYAVSSAAWIMAGFSEEVFTGVIKIMHGNSGLPVLAFQDGVSVVVGIATATRLPDEPFGYVTRIDMLLPILDALTHRAP